MQPGSSLPPCSFPGLEQKHLKYEPMGDISKHSKVSLGFILTSFSWVLTSTSFEVITLLSLVLRYLLSSSSNSFHPWLASSRFSGDVLSCSHSHFYSWGLQSILDLGAVRFTFCLFKKIIAQLLKILLYSFLFEKPICMYVRLLNIDPHVTLTTHFYPYLFPLYFNLNDLPSSSLIFYSFEMCF